MDVERLVAQRPRGCFANVHLPRPARAARSFSANVEKTTVLRVSDVEVDGHALSGFDHATAEYIAFAEASAIDRRHVDAEHRTV